MSFDLVLAKRLIESRSLARDIREVAVEQARRRRLDDAEPNQSRQAGKPKQYGEGLKHIWLPMQGNHTIQTSLLPAGRSRPK